MTRGELIAAAIIFAAIVVRGWPRRRADRWSMRFEVTRDRSDGDGNGRRRRRRDPPPAP